MGNIRERLVGNKVQVPVVVEVGSGVRVGTLGGEQVRLDQLQTHCARRLRIGLPFAGSGTGNGQRTDQTR